MIKIAKKLNIWKQRELTIYGKTFALSQLLYVSSILNVPSDIIKEVEELMYHFLWNGKKHKVKKRVIIQDYIYGGCNMVDLGETLKTQKIKWVKKVYENKNMPWVSTMKTILKVSDLNIFFRHAALINKHVTPFYEEVLRCWNEVRYKRIDSVTDVLDQCIWFNEEVKVNDKPLFYKYLHDSGIY